MSSTTPDKIMKKIEKEYLQMSLEQDIWEILLLDPDLRCTCDEVVREDEIYRAKSHYHHCMLYQVAKAVEVSFRIFVKRDGFVLDESGKSGRFEPEPEACDS